jgi:hypothetical protein
MRVVFAGNSFCDFRTMQRLVLIADEIGFIDRPAVTFGHKWGLIGHAADIRRYNTRDLPIVFSAHEPPSSMEVTLYERFAEADMNNPSFIRTLADGLAHDELFARKFIQFEADYAGVTGRQIRDALVGDGSLACGTYADPAATDVMMDVATAEGRQQIFKVHLIEASVHVTSAMFIAERTGLTPVTNDPFFARLIALRAGDSAYIGSAHNISAPLSLAVASAVVPDSALDELNLGALLEYRAAARDAYHAWSTEIDRLAALIAETEAEKVQERITRLIATDVAPKVLQYQNEMATVRDKLFGDLIKRLTTWELPSLSLAYVADVSFAKALAVFAAAAVPAIPAVVDYFQSRRTVRRNNAMSYLIGVSSARS